MSGTKPTPGPWELRGFKIYVPGTEKCIAEARIAWKSSAETAANARLIVRAVNCHADLVAALEALVADVLEYERINNLAPNPGRRDCWQSVTNARAILSRARAP